MSHFTNKQGEEGIAENFLVYALVRNSRVSEFTLILHSINI